MKKTPEEGSAPAGPPATASTSGTAFLPGREEWRQPILWLTAAAVVLAILFPVILVVHAHRANDGIDGFPLDDPWIHLTYAKNLARHHTFAYFPGDPSTQGSTSPLYTVLLSLGFLVTSNEKVLSYFLGLLFHAGFLGLFALWARRRLGDWAWAAAAVLFIGLDPRIGMLTVSGMETSLFLFLIAAAFLARSHGRVLVTALAVALAVWVRPDGLILVVLFGADLLYERRANAGWVKAAALGAGVLALYFVFNLAVGGSLLPNTFAAKTAYYRMQPRIPFLLNEGGAAFFSAAWRILLPLCLFALVREAFAFFRRRPPEVRLEAAWALALPAAYFVLLPFAHRFERYLLPALPAVTILALSALKQLTSYLLGAQQSPDTRGRRPARPAPGGSRPVRGFPWASRAGIAAGLVLAAALALQVRVSAAAPSFYALLCHYHYVRHERTGRWLLENTEPTAVVATHDVGAIAFYSGRRVVDMVGVVLPEAVVHLNQPNYLPYLTELFTREKVTHVATLRNWCEVVNVEPLFVADPQPEIMEVYPWVPGRTHLMPKEASSLNGQAAAALRQQNLAGALGLLERSITIDPESSRTWMLLGVAREFAGRPEPTVQAYRQAISLYPAFEEARFRLAGALAAQGRTDEAKAELRPLAEKQPPFPGSRELYRRLQSE